MTITNPSPMSASASGTSIAAFAGSSFWAQAPAEVPLDRRELVGIRRDHHRAGGHRPVRPVQRVRHDACERPDGQGRTRRITDTEVRPLSFVLPGI